MNNGKAGEVQPAAHTEYAAPEMPSDKGELPGDTALEQAASDEQRVGKHQPPAAGQQVVDLPVLPVATDDDQTQTDDNATDKKATNEEFVDKPIDEKQWVAKAKSIVNENRDDPFAQKSEMSKFKADYIKKRYNKTIPTG